MNNSNDKHLTQVFEEGNVILTIKSFKSEKWWNTQRKDFDLKNVWDFIEWIVPKELFNIHNYGVIKERFVGIPTMDRIFAFLKEHSKYRARILIDLHNPFKGCQIKLGHTDEDIEIPYNPDSFILSRGKHQYVIQSYINPDKEKSISLLTQFSFYEIFSKYVAMGNANAGSRTFMVVENGKVETDKITIGRSRNIVWRGVAFEKTIPSLDPRRCYYHRIKDGLDLTKGNISFFETFRLFTASVNNYATSANGNTSRISYAVGYIPIPYTDADYIMRDTRQHISRLNLTEGDFDATFIPYLEIGDNPFDFNFGVVTR